MEVPRHWRLKKQRYALVGEVCPSCGAKLFPPRDVCPVCKTEAKTAYAFSGRGEVLSYTVVTQPPAEFAAQAPYVVALVRLEEGPTVTAQLTDLGAEEPYIGMPVEMVTRRLRTDQGERGVILYGYKFRPRLQTAARV
ncbi:MAG: Zn-ribbon domain-containing OB-fold protein [Chloroflexi bacterium]|nr:Zn-ribbon domain-containing OB-fold protein [Chloroflexota bacterium]